MRSAMDRAHERILGTVLVILGVGLLLFAVDQAYTHIGDLSTRSPSPPNAAFRWSVSGLSVTLTDVSRPGSAPITSTYWSFGDGNATYAGNTTHTYGQAGTYNVTLTVQDSNGYTQVSAGQIAVSNGASSTGAGSPSTSPDSLSGVLGDLNLGSTLSGFVNSAELFVLLAVVLIAGGSILRAGWNLITPKAETIQVRVKPRSLQVEPVGVSAPTAPSTESAPVPTASGSGAGGSSRGTLS